MPHICVVQTEIGISQSGIDLDRFFEVIHGLVVISGEITEGCALVVLNEARLKFYGLIKIKSGLLKIA